MGVKAIRSAMISQLMETRFSKMTPHREALIRHNQKIARKIIPPQIIKLNPKTNNINSNK